MSRIDPVVEQAVDTLDLNRVTRRRLLGGIGLTSASLAASALPLDPAAVRTEAAAKQALAAADLPVLPERVVHSATEAAGAATALGSRWC